MFLKQISLNVGVNYSKNHKVPIFFEKLLHKSISKLQIFFKFALRSFVNFDPVFFLATYFESYFFKGPIFHSSLLPSECNLCTLLKKSNFNCSEKFVILTSHHSWSDKFETQYLTFDELLRTSIFLSRYRTKDWTQGENFVTVSLQKKNLFTFKEEEWERARSIPRLESFFFPPTPSWKQPPPPPTQSWNLPWGLLIIMSLPYGRNFFGGRSQAATVVGSDFTLLPFDNLGGLPAYFFLPP